MGSIVWSFPLFVDFLCNANIVFLFFGFRLTGEDGVGTKTKAGFRVHVHDEASGDKAFERRLVLFFQAEH